MKKLRQTIRLIVLTLTLNSICFSGFAQSDTTRVESKSKEAESRNVMLNAASANGPREISIGLPGGDVSVLENGLPVVFSSNPHNANTHWRGDSSIGESGLLKISETAITTGSVGYALDSHTELGLNKEKNFNGTVNYSTNHYGKQQFDMNLNGNMGRGWYFSGNVYQNFDPGSFDLKFAQYQDRTAIYKFALTKLYGNGRGQFSAIYHSSSSNNLSSAASSAPFIYVGDGSIEEIPRFSLGTSSYLPVESNITYMDIRSGEVKTISLYDASKNYGNQLALSNKYRWDNGLEWRVNMKYDKSQGSCLYQSPMSMGVVSENNGYSLVGQDGVATPYVGNIQSRMSCFNRGYIDEFFFTSELTKKYDNMSWRLGVNEWFYNVDYSSNTSMYDHTVEEYPQFLYGSSSEQNYYGNTPYYNFNQNASEYYKGYENKVAVYLTHDWDVSSKFNLYTGVRLEYQRIDGENAAITDEDGNYIGRSANYYLGGTSASGVKIEPTPFNYDWLNYVATFAAIYKISPKMGLTADFTYNTQHPSISNFASAEMPNVDRVSIPLVRAGVYYNSDWISLTSLFSYIAKNNNNSTLNLINPNNPNEIKASSFSYDIQTMGWTTDAIIKPFKGFKLHALLTLQNPIYMNYETSVTFADQSTAEIDATGNIVTEIPKVLIELDPSYDITEKLNLWLSFRYFSKTYANIKNAYYFSGRWETFGGINWKVNKNLSLSGTVINFLNQTGARGSIAGAELVGKEDAEAYYGSWMTGSYIRPFTVEFSAKITF